MSVYVGREAETQECDLGTLRKRKRKKKVEYGMSVLVQCSLQTIYRLVDGLPE
jgi:hypothetical protein